MGGIRGFYPDGNTHSAFGRLDRAAGGVRVRRKAEKIHPIDYSRVHDGGRDRNALRDKHFLEYPA